MTPRKPILKVLWLVVFASCVVLSVWQYAHRLSRVRFANQLGLESSTRSSPSASESDISPGRLIMPEHLSRSFTLLRETKRLLRTENGSITEVKFENAPKGRAVQEAPLYRWWLGSLSISYHHLTGNPLDDSVEAAALYADPLLHAALFVSLVLYVLFAFKTLPSIACAVSITCLFPLSEAFLPAVPDEFSLFVFLLPWSILPLLAGSKGSTDASEADQNPNKPSRTGLHFVLAGCAGGLGLWVNCGTQSCLIMGIICAGFVRLGSATSDTKHRDAIGLSQCWRLWSLAGGFTILVAYYSTIYRTNTSNWDLQRIHPLYGLAWILSGEFLACAVGVRWRRLLRPLVLIKGILAILTIASISIIISKSPSARFLEADTLSFRLSKQIDGIASPNTATWLNTEGLSIGTAATLLSLVPLMFACGCLFSKRLETAHKRGLALLLLPTLFSAVMSFRLLQWWQIYQILACCLVVAITWALVATRQKTLLWCWIGSASLALLVGAAATTKPYVWEVAPSISGPEMHALIERDLAHWLRKQQLPNETLNVFAAPRTTASLGNYGEFDGVASLSKQNIEGLSAALRIAVATSWDEVRLLVEQRKISYIVVNSWDDFYESYVAANAGSTSSVLLNGLRRFELPSWIKPIAYQLPTAEGFGNADLRVYKIVEDQDPPGAACRLVEYFVEMNELANAKIAASDLKRFPSYLGKLVAEADVAYASGETETYRQLLKEIISRTSGGTEVRLPFDLRVNLALVLARGGERELSRKQTQACVKIATNERLRTLSSYTLFHLLTLQDILDVKFATPELGVFALSLLPDELAHRRTNFPQKRK